ncbi:MAG: DUF433 domain-containing protein [Armatimonadetes bacterium]|nr:DUF433 domain-containing protein [Armatimonadota bacterium]
MNKSLQPWQLDQLSNLARWSPERVEHALNNLWEQDASLYEELVLNAVMQDQISVAEGAAELHLSPEHMENRIRELRNSDSYLERIIDLDSNFGNVARLSKSRVAIWEILREYRRTESIDELAKAFPLIKRGELLAALQYASQNEGEVERQIENFESLQDRIRSQYPSLK